MGPQFQQGGLPPRSEACKLQLFSPLTIDDLLPFQALSHVTKVLRDNDFKGLKGLLSNRAAESIQREVETEWDDLQRNNLDFEPDEVNIANIVRIYTHNVAYDRYADVDVHLVAVRQPRSEKSPAVSAIFLLTFSRKYSPGALPDWIITKFKIKRFLPLTPVE